MNAKRENGYLVFETTHFSYYAVVQMKNVSTAKTNSSSDLSLIANSETGGT